MAQAQLVIALITAAATVVSSQQQASAAKASGRASAQAAEFSALETEAAAKREKTQAALEATERERQLRRLLSAQRAQLASGGAALGIGSNLRLQEAAISDTLRQQRQAGLFSALSVSSLNRQAGQQRSVGTAAKRLAGTQATSLLVSGTLSAAGTAGSAISQSGIFNTSKPKQGA